MRDFLPIALLCLVLCCSMNVAPSFGTAAVELPNTPPAERLSEILEIFNAGDRGGLMDYALKHFTPGMLKPTPDSIVDFLMGQYESSGGYDIRRVLQSEDVQIMVLVQGRQEKDQWVRFLVGAEPEEPHRVQGLFTYRASAALAEEGDDPIKPEELLERFETMIDRLAKDGDFSGTVCLSKGGESLINGAWGFSNRENETPNEVETAFGIASLGKMFTAVAIAQLVEKGSLSFEDPIRKYIPDWVGPESKAITVEHLLTHRSGLGDYLGPAMEDRSRTYDQLEDYRHLALRDKPRFTPGDGVGYSNTGFLLLGALIQEVSGQRWDEYLAKQVFEPSGMKKTHAYRPLEDKAVAIGYYYDDERDAWVPNTDLLVGRGTSAGGSASTSEDLVAFANALVRGDLVSPETLERMKTPRSELQGTGMLYGYGVTVSAGEAGERVFGHEGGFPGVSSLLEIYEEDGYVLAVLANQRSAQQIREAWRDMLRRSSE